MQHRIITIQARGCAEFRRYIIADNQNGFWSGKVWNPNEQDALLYHDVAIAAKECHALQKEETENKRHLRMAVVPVMIEVHSDEPLTEEELQRWAEKNIGLILNYKSGSGPTTDSIVLCNIDWPTYRSVSEVTKNVTNFNTSGDRQVGDL